MGRGCWGAESRAGCAWPRRGCSLCSVPAALSYFPSFLSLQWQKFSSALAAEQWQPLAGTSMPFVASPGFQDDELILS